MGNCPTHFISFAHVHWINTGLSNHKDNYPFFWLLMNTLRFIADPRGDALINPLHVTKISRGWDEETGTYHIFLASSVDDGILWEFASASERDVAYARIVEAVV